MNRREVITILAACAMPAIAGASPVKKDPTIIVSLFYWKDAEGWIPAKDNDIVGTVSTTQLREGLVLLSEFKTLPKGLTVPEVRKALEIKAKTLNARIDNELFNSMWD